MALSRHIPITNELVLRRVEADERSAQALRAVEYASRTVTSGPGPSLRRPRAGDPE
jgi:hypothetical protein